VLDCILGEISIKFFVHRLAFSHQVTLAKVSSPAEVRLLYLPFSSSMGGLVLELAKRPTASQLAAALTKHVELDDSSES
jgi:hypothetical protein